VVVAQEAPEGLVVLAVQIASTAAPAQEVPVVVQTEAAVQALRVPCQPQAGPVAHP
jgi:hypothetical protein